MNTVQSPFPQFLDTDGTPLDGGFVYVGQVGQNPETSPVSVYWDAALTQPAAQPLKTRGGYVVRGGTIAPVYINADDYSLTCKTAYGKLVFYASDVTALSTIRTDLASTSDAAKGDAMIGVKLAATGAVARTQHDKNAERKTDQDFGVVVDGATDGTTTLGVVASSGLTDIIITGPIYINGTLTLPSTLALHFEDKGSFIIGGSAVVTINGPVYSNHNPFRYAAGTGTLTVSAQTLAVPGTYSTVQKAIDAVPGMLWQDWTVSLAAGTYAEDVRIESKSGSLFKPGSSATAASRAQLTITGAAGTARDSAVKVKSFIAIDCHGGAYHPAIANLTVTGKNAYTNENEAVAFYGCTGGAVSKVSFDGTGANKCVMSFGSRVTVEGLHFGTAANNIGLVTKHGGQIVAPDAFALNGQLDLEGSLIDNVIYPISGYIDVANIAKATCAGYYEYDDTGLRSGIGFQALNRALSGPKWFHEFLSSWQTYFSSTSEFESSVDAGATLAFVSAEGLNLQTVNTKQASFWLRRNRSIQTTQRQLSPSQLVVSMYVNTVTGDGIVKFGNKGSVSEAGYGFKITTTGLYGYYQNGAGAEVLTSLLVPYATLNGKTWTLYANAQYGGSVIFKALNDSAGGFKQQLAEGTVSGSSTYQWFAQASSAVTGTADVTFSEARTARY